MEETQSKTQRLMVIAAKIVSAYVSKSPVTYNQLPSLIVDIHHAIERLPSGAVVHMALNVKPAARIRKSVTEDYLICLEDGRQYQALKNHLRAKHGLSPEDYRRKWDLPDDYPMVAPSYSKTRSKIAKALGFGRTPTKPSRPSNTRVKRERTR